MVNGVSSKNASERKPPIPAKSAGKPLMSKMPTRSSLRSSPPKARVVGAASGTATSWPDMRRPLKVAPVGVAADGVGQRGAEERQPDPGVEHEARLDRPSTVTGTVTRWCR